MERIWSLPNSHSYIVSVYDFYSSSSRSSRYSFHVDSIYYIKRITLRIYSMINLMLWIPMNENAAAPG
jgi:hypothetical protein